MRKGRSSSGAPGSGRILAPSFGMATSDDRDRALLVRSIVAREHSARACERARFASLHAHAAAARSRALSTAQATRRKLTTPRAGAGDVATEDAHVRMLAELFRRHPAWVQAARYVTDGAESAVAFTHLPRRRWHVVRREGETLLLPGLARDPDFAFRFTPAAVEGLAAVDGDIGDFAVELFARIAEPRKERRVDFRIVAPFSRLVRHGYLRLLLAAGPKVARFGAAHGVRTLRDLRALVAAHRRGTASPRR